MSSDDSESSCEDDVEEEEEDEEIDVLDTKSAVESLFSTLVSQGGGNFTCGGKLASNFGLPGLELIIPRSSSSTRYEYKPIALPILSKEQANELISQCSKAPYGKGEKTIYDDKVRNSWQLSPSQFRISNKNWNEMLDELMNGELKRGLGIDENVKIKCSLYKLLLYEKGGHFEFHRDTEKEDQMFATLVIQLPSVYKGGNIIVKHGSNEEVYDLSNESSYTPFYFSFYCDCKHKVDVITSGYRTCLIYNVSYISGSKPILTDNTILETTFNNIVEAWELSDPMICYLLEHKYSKAGLSFDCLKGADSKIFQLIKQYNVKHPELAVEVFLGIMTKNQQGYGDPDDITWEETNYEINYMIKKGQNHPITTRFNLKERDIIPEDSLNHLEKSGEDIEVNTGNEGASAWRWYKSACLIIYPKKFKYLMALRFDDSSANTGLEDLWKAYKEDPSLRDQLVKYVSDYMKKSRGTQKVGNIISDLKELSLAKQLVSQPRCSNEEIIEMTKQFGVDALRAEIIAYFKRGKLDFLTKFLVTFPDNSLTQLLIPILLRNNYSYDRSGIQYEKALAVCKKFKIKLDNETRRNILSGIDVSKLYELGCKLKDTYCLKEVLRKAFSVSHNSIKYMHSNYDVVLAKMPVNIVVNSVQTIGLENCRALLEQLTSEFVNRNSICSSTDVIQLFSDITDNIVVTDFISKSIMKNITKKSDLKSQNIAIYEKLFIQFYKCGAIDEMNEIVKLLLSQKTSQYIQTIINPLVSKISRVNTNVINSQPLQHLIRSCIRHYNSIITASKPSNDWVVNAELACTCYYCKECNNFLKSPTEITHSFRLVSGYREHIESTAKKATIDLEYETLKQGSPHTLVLTKTGKSEELKKKELKEAIAARSGFVPLLANTEGLSSSKPPKKKVK